MDPRSIATAANLIRLAWQSGHCEAARDHAKTGMVLTSSNVEMLTRVANYELNCNGDGKRANELLRNAAFTGYLQILVARDAAEAARDYLHMLDLSTHNFSLDDTTRRAFDQLFRVRALRYLKQDDAAMAELTSAGDALLLQESSRDESWLYAAAMSEYYSLLGDVDLLRSWLAEADRRRDQQTKGDSVIAAYNIRKRASVFAYAGLHDEAIEELRVMVRTPGAARLPFINDLPEYDDISDHPDYIALLEQHSD